MSQREISGRDAAGYDRWYGGTAMVVVSPAAAAPAWTPAVRVDPPTGMAGIAEPPGPRVAMNEAGDAALEWHWFLGGNRAVEVMTRPHGSGAWSRPVALAPDSLGDGVAIDDAGDAFAALTNFAGGEAAQASVSAAGGAAWEVPVTLSADRFSGGSELDVNAAGDAVVGFRRGLGPGVLVAAATRHGARGRWQDIGDISEQIADLGPAVAIDSAGDELALWTRASGTAGDVVAASFRAAGESPWQPAVDVGGPYDSVRDIRVGFDAAGNAVAVWSSFSGVWASYRALGGSWQQAVKLDRVDSAPYFLAFQLRATGTRWSPGSTTELPTRSNAPAPVGLGGMPASRPVLGTQAALRSPRIEAAMPSRSGWHSRAVT
jgi:hypothetical protein